MAIMSAIMNTTLKQTHLLLYKVSSGQWKMWNKAINSIKPKKIIYILVSLMKILDLPILDSTMHLTKN